MEDYLQMRYVGEPSYHPEAGILAWTSSWWDTSASPDRQDFMEQVHIRRLTVDFLRRSDNSAGLSLASPGAHDSACLSLAGLESDKIITAGGRKENHPQVLSDGTVLFLSDAGSSDDVPERGRYEQRRINEYVVAPQLYAYRKGQVRKLTGMLHGVKDYRVSPDEKKVLLECWLYDEADTPMTLVRERSREERSLLLEKSRFTPISYEGFPFKSDAESGYASKRSLTLWVLDLEAACEEDESPDSSDSASSFCGASPSCSLSPSCSASPFALSCLYEGDELFRKACIWSPDSQSLVWQEYKDGKYLFYRKPVKMTGKIRCSEKGQNFPADTSPSSLFAGAPVPGPDPDGHRPVFIPDGTRLYFTAACSEKAPYSAPTGLFCLPVKSPMTAKAGCDAAESPMPETADTNLTAVPVVSDQNTPDGVHPDEYNFALRGDSGCDILPLSDGSCLFLGGDRGDIRIFREQTGKTPRALTSRGHNFRCLCPVTEGLLIAVHSDPLHLPELVLLNVRLSDKGRTERDVPGTCPDTGGLGFSRIVPLTDENPWLRGKALSAPEEIRVMSLDREEELQGWVILPPGKACANGSAESAPSLSGALHRHSPNGRLPAILCVHGGPNGFYSTALNYEFQALAAAGFAVIFGNPRGGSGYGTEHAVDEKAYGDMAMNDLIQLVDETCRRFPQIDPDRVGITGGSYGGYATIWGASHSGRYKAASAIRPLANFQIIAASTMHAGGSPWQDKQESFLEIMLDAIHKSPNSYADRISCPFQVLQGDHDMNCVQDQAHQLYTAIKDLHPDLPSRLVIYPDSNHGLLHRGPVYLAVMQRIDNLRWFETYL